MTDLRITADECNDSPAVLDSLRYVAAVRERERLAFLDAAARADVDSRLAAELRKRGYSSVSVAEAG
jgi:hypothetical protein